MDYIGSKKSLLEFIEKTIGGIVPYLGDKVMLEPMSGTGIVGHYFKNKVKRYYANDLEKYAFYLSTNYIESPCLHQEWLDRLEELNKEDKGIDGVFSEAFSEQRRYFTPDNGRRIEWIRRQIFNSKPDYYENIFLFSSLIESASKIGNTTGIWATYLKDYKKTSIRPLTLSPSIFESNKNINFVFNLPALHFLDSYSGDIIYLDPPYNNRHYGYYYHIFNAMLDFNLSPDILSKLSVSGATVKTRSQWCYKTEVKEELVSTLQKANCHYVFLSYNNKGLLSPEFIAQEMKKIGRYDRVDLDYKQYKSHSKTPDSKIVESIHILEKR